MRRLRAYIYAIEAKCQVKLFIKNLREKRRQNPTCGGTWILTPAEISDKIIGMDQYEHKDPFFLTDIAQ